MIERSDGGWLESIDSAGVGGRLTRPALTRAARDESPIVLAAVPPATAALGCGALGVSPPVAAWWAFAVALCGQLGWAVVATRQAQAPPRVTVVSLLVNLALGLVLVGLKVAIAH